MVEVATGGRGHRAIRTEYPVTEGITAGTTKLREKASLEYEEDDLTLSDDRVGV